MHGTLAGTGKLVILPVDQGFEHGPARSFAPNPPAYDPHYHFQLAIEAGLIAYAAPLGLLEAGADSFAGADPAHPQAEQRQQPGATGRARPGGDRPGQGRAAARLRRRSASRSIRAPTRLRHDGGAARDRPRGQGRTASPSSSGPTRAAASCRKEGETALDIVRLRRAHRGPAGRAHHQGEAAQAASSRPRPRRSTRRPRYRSRPSPARVRARRAGLLRRPAHRRLLGRRGQGHRRRARRGPRRSATAAASARSSAATLPAPARAGARARWTRWSRSTSARRNQSGPAAAGPTCFRV